MNQRRDGTVSIVSDSKDLDTVIEAAHAAKRVGLDTEFLRERTYRARLCLAQVAVSDQIFLIDPLAGLDLSGVAALLEDSSIVTVVHAGGQDLELFHEQFGVNANRVFDVQRAAGFAGHGASLAYGALVSAVLGVSLKKGESYSDWCRRPLTKAQLDYAADDVRWLLGIADRLAAAIESLGRTQWVAEEMRAIEAAASRSVTIDESWRKVSGRGSLSSKQTAVLREVAWWREQAAAARDIPRGWVVKDVSLVEIARRAPSDRASLARVRGVNAKEAERSWRDIVAAVERGKTQAPVLVPHGPPKSAQTRARMLVGIGDALVRARSERAGIASELVTTRGELEALIGAVVAGDVDEESHRLLQGWRHDLAGDAIVQLARGRIAVRAVEHPPYVEEVTI